ncbi:hypothetical protein V2J09_006502 [Rumex salicifolius]
MALLNKKAVILCFVSAFFCALLVRVASEEASAATTHPKDALVNGKGKGPVECKKGECRQEVATMAYGENIDPDEDLSIGRHTDGYNHGKNTNG